MYNTKIGEFCATHVDWEALLAAEPYQFLIKVNKNYQLNQMKAKSLLYLI